MSDLGTLAGRLLLGAIFVWSGLGKAMVATVTIAHLARLNLPVPPVAYAVTVTVELGVGLLFVAGLFTRVSALVLAFWCIATAVAAHSNFADRNMLVHFYKNVAICGGFLYAAVLGAGGYSIDAFWNGSWPNTPEPMARL